MMAAPDTPGAAASPPAVAGLILAAGESSRMGADKPLLMYRGKTFLENIIAALRGAGIQRIVVVLGHHAEEIQQALDLAAVEVIVNRDYRQGQTSSLQAGLQLLARNIPDCVVVCLVDHPAITADTVGKLIHHFKYSGHPVIIPQMNGKHGHPILLAKELFGEFLALGPGQGADTIIHARRSLTEFVEVTDPGILLDVDVPESYRRLADET